LKDGKHKNGNESTGSRPENEQTNKQTNVFVDKNRLNPVIITIFVSCN
jgi:hypothetical protein